jgi:hypothetical protein
MLWKKNAPAQFFSKKNGDKNNIPANPQSKNLLVSVKIQEWLGEFFGLIYIRDLRYLMNLGHRNGTFFGTQ